MSGMKKFMHKIKEKMETVGEGHHHDHQGRTEKVGGQVRCSTSVLIAALI